MVEYYKDKHRWGSNYRAEIPSQGTDRRTGLASGFDVAEVNSTRPSWMNHYEQSGGHHSLGPGAYTRTTRQGAGVEARDRAQFRRTGEGAQGTLFSAEPGSISSAFSAPSTTRFIPTLLGMVANEHAQYGTLPMPDADLSSHSSKMTKKLLKRIPGIPRNPDNPTARATNSISMEGHGPDWENQRSAMDPYGRRYEDYTPVEQRDVQAARETVRGFLRPQPKPRARRGGSSEQSTPPPKPIPGQRRLRGIR